MKHNKIALIGMMGSGKSTIGKILSQNLNLTFIDSDNIFEKENNIKIVDFFAQYGENKFRDKEYKILNKISKKTNFILSTGGGIILKEENQNILFNQDIFTIYLKTTAKTIFNRIKYDKSRPLLQVDDPLNEIKKIIDKREKFYSKANLTIITDNKTQAETAKEITDELWKK